MKAKVCLLYLLLHDIKTTKSGNVDIGLVQCTGRLL